MAYSTVTLTGTYKIPDGTPAQGVVEIIPSEKVIVDAVGNVVLSGRVKVTLNALGSFSIALPATNDPGLNPTNFGYTVSAKLHHAHLPAVSFSLPLAVATVDIADVTPVAASTFVASATYATRAELAAATNLTVVASGVIDLPNAQPDGYLVGYRLTATVLVEGVSFPAGSYIFERNSLVYGGWTYRTLAVGTQVVPTPDTTAPTAPTLSVNNSSQTQLVATFSGGTDAVGVTQYRTRIDAGSWLVGASPRTFTGLLAGTAHTIDAQAGDAAGNWSASTSWTGSTAAAGPTPITDTFTAADNTALAGRTPTTGTVSTWAVETAMNFMSTATTPNIVGNKMALTGAPATNVCASIALPAATTYVASFDYTIAASGVDGGVKIGVGDASGNHWYAQVGHNGGAYLLKGDFSYNSGEIAGRPLTGTLLLEVTASTITAKINGTTFATTARTGGAFSSPKAAVAIYSSIGDAFTIDNFQVTV